MPFVETGTLSDLLVGRPQSLEQVRKVTTQIGDALDYAHSLGIVHRDIKPSNVLIDQRGNCLLADFGIAKMVEGTAQFTQTGGIVGTPAYMSPEQGLGTQLDGRSDIYSLGVILYEMATGRPPYHAETPMAVVIKHIHDPLPPPRSINPQITGDFENILMKALAKNRNDRYPTCADLVQAVQSLPNPPEPASTLIDPKPAITNIIESPAADSGSSNESPASQEAVPKPPTFLPTSQTRERPKWMPWVLTLAVVLCFGVLAISIVRFLLSSLENMSSEQSVSALTSHTVTAMVFTDADQSLLSNPPTDTPIPTIANVTDTLVPTKIITSTPVPTEPALGIGDILTSPIDGSVMKFIPAGEFLIGAGENDPDADPDEFPQREIFLDAYWIDQFEVTNQQYQVCVDAGECTPPKNIESATRFRYYDDAEFADYPVINVTWFDAASYCEWRKARLPTEAEWEKAARGVEGSIYPWGDTFEEMRANYCASSILCPDEPEDGFIDTAPVGSFMSGISSYGVQDMAGNVSEWLADWYDENYYDSLTEFAENPSGPDGGERRGIRGGSFGLNASKLRTTNRGSENPSHYGPYDGFRCAQSAD
jgi:formylglycine-generating enzyme required for sulfatase activity/serine/threonine protein kinase